MNKIKSKKYITYALLVLGGLALGWIFFHNSTKKRDEHNHSAETAEATIWTCSMHPQIRRDAPGDCPICGMDLIPLNQSSPDSALMDPNSIHLTREAAQLANVMTSVVTRQKPVKELRLYGKVQADERLLQSQVAHLPGRIERLLVNFTGEQVRKGQALAEIYSPELVTAQQELLEAASVKDQQPEIYEAARERLHHWKLSAQQINDIEQSGKVKTNFPIVSNTNGIVTARRIKSGDHVSEGTVLFDIADLSSVWILFDAYESDLPFLNKGDLINFTAQALPGESFSGRISFIDPVIDAVNRVSKARVEINNQSRKLKPEMFVTGVLKANMEQFAKNLVIPRSAVMWTGKRSIVYVKQPGTDEPVFKMREIGTGPTLGNSFIVLDGLEEGEEIVTQGTFNVDAAAQLEGKPSMMNPAEGEQASSMPGMEHGSQNAAVGSESSVTAQGSEKTQTLDKKTRATTPANKSQTHTDHTTAVSSQSNTGQKPSINSSAKTGEKPALNKDFKTHFGKVTDQYLALKNAFVQSDAVKAKAAAQSFNQSLDKVDMNLLTGDDHMKWMDYLTKFRQQAKVISSTGDLSAQRTAFSVLSDQFYKAVKTFGLSGKTVYYQFCPMANNNKGAYWISESKDIRNPYFGDQMLTCGETRETLKY